MYVAHTHNIVYYLSLSDQQTFLSKILNDSNIIKLSFLTISMFTNLQQFYNI